MTEATTEMPVWDERDRPQTYLRDTDGRSFELLSGDSEVARTYLNWLNEYREPLHEYAETIHPLALRRANQRGIDLSAINHRASVSAGTAYFPLYRYVAEYDLTKRPDYDDGVNAEFYGYTMRFGNRPRYAEHMPNMGLVRIIGDLLSTVVQEPKDLVVDVIAQAAAKASLQRTLKLIFPPREEGGPQFNYDWAGYTWRAQDSYWGYLIEEAVAAKTAYEVRADLRIPKDVQPMGHKVADPYYVSGGFTFGHVGAVVLDTIDKSAKTSGSSSLWKLARHQFGVEDDAAREELSSIIGKATSGEISLEELESVKVIAPSDTLPDEHPALVMLDRVEAACGVDESWRAGRLVRQRQNLQFMRGSAEA